MDVLPDLLMPDLRLVFCGTAPSRTSARMGAYYAFGRNRFWRILHETGLTDELLEPEQFKELTNFGIGLTDLCKFASGNDDQLPAGALNPTRLRQSISFYRPQYLAFTSGNAGKALCGAKAQYGWQEPIEQSKIYILPTTSSRRGKKWWDMQKWHWHNFADAVLASARS